MKKMHLLLLAILSVGLSSCAGTPPSEGYLKAKSALVDAITQDMKEGGE